MQRIEDALYSGAHLAAENLAAQRTANKGGSFAGEDERGRARARTILSAAAMPDLDRIDLLGRQQLTLERQISSSARSCTCTTSASGQERAPACRLQLNCHWQDRALT